MVGSWTALGLFLAASCLSARGAPLAPGAQGTFPPGAFGCGARQDGQAQVQATGGLEAGLGQSWSEECPSVPRLASSSSAPVPAAEVTAAEGEGEGEGEGVATIARGDSTRLVKSVPETAARDEVEEEEVVEEQDDGIQEGLVQEETGEAEAEARGQATLTTITTTTSATSKAATTSATAQSSAEERQRGSAPVTSVPSDNTEEKRVSWLENGHRDAAEPGDQVAEEEEEEEEEDEGEGVALLHAASLTASPATDGQKSRAAADAAAASDTAFATVPPSAKPAMPMATPPSGGPSGRKTDGWGVAQMAQQSGDPAQAGGQAERGQQPGSATLTPDMTRGAAPEGHGGGGYEGGWEAAATQAPRVALTSPNSEGGRELAATAASVAAAVVEPTQPPSDDSQEDQHLGDGTVPWTAESSVLLRSGETGAGATSPASGPSWASQLPPLIPRSDAPLAETWSVAAGLQGAEGIGVLSSSQEAGMEPALSSEDLPLIFEPFDDATTAGATATMPPRALAPAELATGTLTEADLERVVTMDADRVLSDIPPPGAGEWPSPWQMSGVEMAETVEPSRRPISTVYPGGPADHTGADITQNPPRTPPTSSATLSASVTQQSPMATVTKAAHFPAVRPKSGLEELESEEEEDEENEDIEDSEEEEDEEEESDEDLTDVPAPAPTRPPYSLIPPPPVWVQRNQGLARSWVELIREKAGYVSGMLAPVGIGIAGALLIVGALYSIRMIHRKRRNSFKHQRRKQPREVRTGQDQAMLLADSSEDEF